MSSLHFKGDNTWWNGEGSCRLPLTIQSFSKFLWCWGLETSRRENPFWRKSVQNDPRHYHSKHRGIGYQFLDFYLFQMPITYYEPNENFPFIFMPFQWDNFKLFYWVPKNKLCDTFWPTCCKRKWLIYKKLSWFWRASHRNGFRLLLGEAPTCFSFYKLIELLQAGQELRHWQYPFKTSINKIIMDKFYRWEIERKNLML